MGRPRLVAPARVRVCTIYCRSMDGECVHNVSDEVDANRRDGCLKDWELWINGLSVSRV
jgi:hypothetical protein